MDAFFPNANLFGEFFEIKDKNLSKKIFLDLLWEKDKIVKLPELLVNWISFQRYNHTNKAYLSFFVIDIEEKGAISFIEAVDLIVWLNLSNKRLNTEKILRKIWEKMNLNLEKYIELSLFEKIVENFSKVLFSGPNPKTEENLN